MLQLLSSDLDFHGQDSSYASHNFHSFPAKFPPQLPRTFIEHFTEPGDAILDPMMGSGTSVLEAFLHGRQGIGVDIDPLALLLTQVKVTPLDRHEIKVTCQKVVEGVVDHLNRNGNSNGHIPETWDKNTKKFVDYWFAPDTQCELLALLQEIQKIEDENIRAFFELAFSAIIITKSGGVSLAFDLAHTRPHRAKVVYSREGNIILGHELAKSDDPRIEFLTKTLRTPLEEFQKRVEKNLQGIVHRKPNQYPAILKAGDAQCLPLERESVDLIVTSPPYASNAIDYMRAHKFALIWLGHSIDELSERRGEYIGGESIRDFEFEPLPTFAEKVIGSIGDLDVKKGLVLRRYYSEMTCTLREMYRVLRPGKGAVVVVGNSIMRGKDTQTAECLAEIGKALGFEVPKIGVRNLDRNRRMLPAGHQIDSNSQIQQRMHEEYVIGFYKP
ncbi:MAG TPA: DNA methyltransferase [Anaerolineales bacterium]|nr:DNA methyltransferase [Anaerolineales bacterium]